MIYYLTATGNGCSPDDTLPAGAVVCTQEQYANASAWTVSAGAIIAATPPAPSLAQQTAKAMIAGLAITSTSKPALNGIYDVSAASQAHFSAEMIALLNIGGQTFADGTTSVEWPDMASPPVKHTFSAVEFKAFGLAVGAYTAALYKCVNGTLATLPAASAAIP
jgi:hypothetical protein